MPDPTSTNNKTGKVHVTLSTGRTVVLTWVSDAEWSLELPSSKVLTEGETTELGKTIEQLHRGRCSTCSCGEPAHRMSIVAVDVTFTEAGVAGERVTC